MKPFMIRWLVTTIAVAISTQLTGIEVTSWGSLLGASLLLGIINAMIRPVLLLLSLPLIVFTLGFFILVVNALMLWLVGGIVPGFNVPGFWSAFFGAIFISIVSWALSAFFRTSDGQVKIITHHSRARVIGEPKPVKGRVIE
jgi:putative membrane protein